MIQFPAEGHETYEFPKVRDTPHYLVPKGGYDGQFYAQLAVDPLIKDGAIDRAMDNAPYRARRILFSWTAWLAGLGRPAWILQAYALQNVVAWLALAWLLTRWFPIGSARSFALWSGCLLTHGLLISVRAALLDGPSLLLLAGAATLTASATDTASGVVSPAPATVARPRVRDALAVALVGLSGLARETNLLGVVMFVRAPGQSWRSWRSWLRFGVIVIACAIPLLLWLDYLRSIYLTSALGGVEQFARPLDSLDWKLTLTLGQLRRGGWHWTPLVSLIAIIAFLWQGGFVIWCVLTRRETSSPWLLLGLMYFALGLVTSHSVWEGTPGPITRLTLPLTVAFNVLARRAPWPAILVGNLGIIPGIVEFGFAELP